MVLEHQRDLQDRPQPDKGQVGHHDYKPDLIIVDGRVLTFPLACLRVSLPQSGLLRAGSHRLVLEKVTEECQGTYTCQVTSGSPPFHTGEAGHHLGVSVLPPPGSHPVLAGVQHHYQLGQHLSATCTSSPSNPSARIQWTLNGEQVG